LLLFILRFGVKAVIPGFSAFGRGMIGSFICAFAILVWWAFFSRAPWFERWATIVLMAIALGLTWLIRHDSMGPVWLVGYAVPVLCLALVAWAVATRNLPNKIRRATLAAVILVTCGAWALVRMEGINGDHDAKFRWRWSPSTEERILAEGSSDEPAPMQAAPATPASSATQPVILNVAQPAASASPQTATKASKNLATVPSPTKAEWPGFRGPGRDGIVHSGVRIKTDWSGSPPVQLWRRPIGPGWSSFAVDGDLVYTQEQRGDNEVVACYKASTGKPVWFHRDAARFFESNGGAGPRGTPTLSNGRIYTFGATGILNALDPSNGAMVWSHNVASETNTKVPYWGFSSSPLVVGDIVIVAAAGQLVAYDLASGAKRWLGPAGGGGYSSPQLATIDGVAQVLLISGAGVTSVSPADGKQLWRYQWASSSIVQPALTADGDILISNQETGTRRIAVAQDSSGWKVEERWTSNGLKPYFNDFVVHKDHAYGFDGRILACIDLKDGQRNWKGGRYGNGQLVLLPEQDLLLVLSEEGELALVQATPEQFTELAKFSALEGKNLESPGAGARYSAGAQWRRDGCVPAYTCGSLTDVRQTLVCRWRRARSHTLYSNVNGLL